jgi:DNA processing protein
VQATDPLPFPGLPCSPADDPSAGLAGWLRLLAADGVGPVAARALLERFTCPAAIFGASFSALCDVVRPDQARALLAAPSDAAQLDATRAWLARPGNTLLRLTDPAYPPYLKELPDAPLLLYVKGDLSLLARPALAVVGSRNASAQGLQNAARFSRALSEAGITIVSGLALGIDAAAHEGGLAGVGASVAVIGTGADVVYPRRNHALAHRLADEGCIVSEYALGTPPMAANFPRRNRLISGLARGVLVVEAAAKSGSLITARMAAEQGREVFAIPGSIHAVLAKGCHALIREGAKLVETAEDILEELRWSAAAPAPLAASQGAGDDTLLAAMAFEPADIDTLVARTGLSAADVSVRLLALELAEMVQRLPGGQFQRLVL